MTTLRKAAEEYLAMRRGFGFKLYGPGILLLDFISFMEKRHASRITIDLAVRWAKLPASASPSWWAARLRAVRLFALYMSATEPRTEVPPPSLLPYRYKRRPPYIYTDQEVKRLIQAARGLPPKWGLGRWIYPTLFGLLSVTGIRISEALGLDYDAVDLTHDILTIRGTKFGKTRLVPIHPSTKHALQVYGRKRDQLFPKPKTPAFFLSDRGIRLSWRAAHSNFIRLSVQIGLRRPLDRHGPRLHDFRHAFAVKTLLRWYRAGRDVERWLPVLSTYLGHVRVTDTYWYLTATPELLRLAGARLERTMGDLP